MISLQEVGTPVRGAVRLVFGDAGGMEAFDDSPERNRRSPGPKLGGTPV